MFENNLLLCRFFLASIIWCSFFALISPPSIVNADPYSKEDSVQLLDPIVVSATKTPVPLTQTTSAVEIFTEEDFKIRKIRFAVDALRLSQGTAIFTQGGPGTVAELKIRGGNARQTLVLIDGAIVNSGTLGTFNFAHLTVDNIEKIEILRGPQSLGWGADATSGVVNITTKRGQGPIRGSAFLEYGSFNSLTEGGSLSGQIGKFDFSFALSRWDSSGFSAINHRRGASERDSYRNWQASSRVGINFTDDGRLDFNFRWVNGDKNIDSPSGPSDVIKARNDIKQFIFSGIYDQKITNWWSHVLTLSRSQEATPFNTGISQRNLSTGIVSVPFPFEDETRVLANRIESQHNFKITKQALFTAGYQFREQQGENDTGLSNTIISSHGGFAQIQLNFLERVFATAGVRHDKFNTFGDVTTYRVTGGYVHKETDTKVRGSYATGFRAPTINELFAPNFGNSSLQPEKVRSFDFGLDQFVFNKRVKISVGYFWNRFSNLIETIQNAAICGTGSFGVNFCPVNVSSAKTQGWETALRILIVQNKPFFKRLELQGQYTLTSTRNINSGRRLGRWPVDQASLRVFYQPIDPMNIIIDFRFVGSQFNLPSTAQNNTQRVGSFEVVNLTVNYDWTKNVQAYLRAENIFDENYEEILFFGTPGRSIYGGVRLTFDVPFGSNTN